MLPLPSQHYGLWAKVGKKMDPVLINYHPVIHHMIDTAMVVQELWEHVLPKRFVNGFTAAIREENNPKASLSLLTTQHDSGKIGPGFAGKWEAAREFLSANGFDFPNMAQPARHGLITAAYLSKELMSRGFSPSESMNLACVLGGHHGLIPGHFEVKRLSSRQLGNANWQDARLNCLMTIEHLLGARLVPETFAQLVTDKSLLLQLAGLTSVADWIASSEKHFPHAVQADGVVPEPEDYLSTSRELAKRALEDLGWLGWKPDERNLSFMDLFGFDQLRPLQDAVVEMAKGCIFEPTLILIEAPMGEGKTEAALYLYDWLQAVAGQRGLFVGLPTMATSNQMFGRVREFLARRYPEDEVNLHLVHGQAGLDEDFLQLQLNCGEPDEPGEHGRVVAEEWFLQKKRSLLAPFAVGTIDQALFSALQVRHNFVRLFGLSGKVVVIDEVHAYDTYTSELVDRLVEWLAALGSSVILLSATLPRRRAADLLQKYGGPGSEVTVSKDYPRISWVVRGGAAKGVSIGARPQKPILTRHCGPNADSVAEDLVARISASGGCAAWICNTVGQAQNVYELLKSRCEKAGVELTLLHARFPLEKRKEIEKWVVASFGKDSLRDTMHPSYHERPGKAILVTTQILEQSLDLDFDLMVSYVAPIDLLLQRLGRLHRHEGRLRPQGFEEPTLWLIEPGLGEEGLPCFGVDAGVYTEYILLRSWLVLRGRQQIRIPEDVEKLIERVYGLDPVAQGPDLSMALDAALERTRFKADGERKHDEKLARDRIVKSPHDEACLVGEYNADLKEDDPETNAALVAATRLCRPSVQLVCLYDKGNGVASLDPEGLQPVDLTCKPDIASVRMLLNRSVTITHPGVVSYFMKRESPEAWQRSSHLRFHHPAMFAAGICPAGAWEVVLDEKLGIIVRKGSEVDTTD